MSTADETRERETEKQRKGAWKEEREKAAVALTSRLAAASCSTPNES
jgi:hypothetical protein